MFFLQHPIIQLLLRMKKQLFFFFFCKKLFMVTMSPFCGATGTICFRLWLTPLMGFKARVDVPSPSLSFTCAQWVLGVNSNFPGQGLVPILHIGMVRVLLEWLPNVTSRTAGRGSIRTQDLATQSPTLYFFMSYRTGLWDFSMSTHMLNI